MSKKIKDLLYIGLFTLVLGCSSIVDTHYYVSASTNSSATTITQSGNDNLTISNLRNKYQNLINNSNNSNMYQNTPNIQNGVVGSLSNNYRDQMLNWINFYRGLYNIQPLADNSNYDNDAQYGADDLSAYHDGLYHGFSSIQKPSRLTNYNWQRGSDATSQSNIAEGTNDPHALISDYFDDNNNVDGNSTGHRAWLLDQGLRQIGIGQDGNYNDTLVINNSDLNNGQNDGYGKVITYPNSGAFPLKDAQNGMWSVYLPDYYNNKYYGLSINKLNITVHDDTTDKNVPVNNINVEYGYGYYDTINYSVNGIADHDYTVNVAGIPGIGSYSYHTALFNWNSDNDSTNNSQNKISLSSFISTLIVAGII